MTHFDDMIDDSIIRKRAEKYAKNLKEKVDLRVSEMEDDDNLHYLIYRVLGVAKKEGRLIDQ